MRKLRNLIGMPVIFQRQRIGRLIQVDFSPDLKRMEGIWIDSGLRGTRYIAADHLSMVGETVILSDSRGMRKRPHVKQLMQRAISTDGSRTGAIVGAEVDEISFLVSALELSRGFWDDLWYGRQKISSYNADGNEIIVPNSTHQACREEEK